MTRPTTCRSYSFNEHHNTSGVIVLYFNYIKVSSTDIRIYTLAGNYNLYTLKLNSLLDYR